MALVLQKEVLERQVDGRGTAAGSLPSRGPRIEQHKEPSIAYSGSEFLKHLLLVSLAE